MATGMRTTSTDSSIIRRAISDMIGMIDWTEAPLLRRLGMNNEKRFRLLNFPQIKVEWLEDSMSSRADTLNGAMATTTVTTATVDDGTKFKAGDVVEVGTELLHVTTVTSNDLTVVRGYGGTTAATHTDGTAVTLITQARAEGAEALTGHTTTTTNPFNYSQILSEAVKVSGTQMEISDYGIDDQMAYHLAKLIGGNETVGSKFRAGKLPILLENSYWKGRRSAGTSGERAMGGFRQYISTNVTDASSAALTRKMIEDAVEDCFLAGGDPDMILTNTWGLRKLRNMFEGFIETSRSEKRGGSRITTLEMPWGGTALEVVYCRWAPNDEIHIIQSDKMGWVTLRPFDVYELPSTGDYEWRDVRGEFSFVMMNETAHARIHTFSTTA